MGRLDPRLRTWNEKHRPLCPACKPMALPSLECARVWAPDWAAEYYPVDELSDPAQEELLELRRRLDETRETIAALTEESKRRIEAYRELATEVELLRRENAILRSNAEIDFEHANNWRRYVAVVGERRASMFLVPPKKENGH